MADIEKLKINLAKNEEKLQKKIDLLAKYESRKAKLDAKWEKFTKGISFEDSLAMASKEKDLSQYGAFEKLFGEGFSEIFWDILNYYDDSWSPIVQTKRGIKELEDLVNSYKDKIAKEEQIVADREASISAHTTNINGKDVNVILEFLNSWEERCYDYYMNVFENYEKNFMREYEELENTFEYKIIYKSWENKEELSSEWSDTEYASYYSTYEEYQKNARYNDKCYKAIHDNLDKMKDILYSKFNIKAIEEFSKSIFRAKKNVYETNMVAYLKKEKDRKYDQLILDVENIVGQIFDMSNIRVGAKGDLEGYVIGTEGEAELWTTGAGGYNVDSIVNVKHGQCFHFRFYVKRRK